MEFTGGWAFSFRNGYVAGFEGPHSYQGLQNPEQISNFFGAVHISRIQAIELARASIRKLEIPLEMVFADQEPIVRGPFTNGVHVIPYYEIDWQDPRSPGFKAQSVCVEVDAEKQQIERMVFMNKNLERPPPKITVTPPFASDNWPPANIEYAKRLLPIVMQAVDEFGLRMSLQIPRPLTTNQIARFYLCDNGGWPYVELTLTNGWRFHYEHARVAGFYAPDVFFCDGRIKLSDYVGKWNLTQEQALSLARQAIKKFDCDPSLFHVDGPPRTVSKPSITGKTTIPRYLISWDYFAQPNDEETTATATVEIDAGSKTIKSAYFSHRVFLRQKPDIDIPLSLPKNGDSKRLSSP